MAGISCEWDEAKPEEPVQLRPMLPELSPAAGHLSGRGQLASSLSGGGQIYFGNLENLRRQYRQTRLPQGRFSTFGEAFTRPLPSHSRWFGGDAWPLEYRWTKVVPATRLPFAQVPCTIVCLAFATGARVQYVGYGEYRAGTVERAVYREIVAFFVMTGQRDI